MQSLIIWLALGASLLSWGACLALWVMFRRHSEQAQAERDSLLGKIDSLRKQLTELHSGTIGMGRRLQGVEGEIHKLQEHQQELTLQDPDRRLYSRAAKMVELGADIDELMSECELPKAEAELLISLRKGR